MAEFHRPPPFRTPLLNFRIATQAKFLKASSATKAFDTDNYYSPATLTLSLGAARGSRRGAAAASSRAAGENNADSSTPAVTDTPGSATPVPQSIATTSTRGGTTTRATRAPAAGRFRPKNIRRDEAERDSLARQEEQKASERAADERKARGRSRFRSKRSRGDAMGRGGFGRVISGASGPFSSGAA
ncbi:rna polymerase iii rpc4, partial [Fusarium phyllophilum]